MIKILISVYIVAVLLFAGFANAAVNTNTIKIDKVKTSPKVLLSVEDSKFDSRKEILILSGSVSQDCLPSIQPQVHFDSRSNQALVSVYALGTNCLTQANDNYEIVLDIKAIFAQYNLNNESLVEFHIDNYTAGNYSFNYLAKQQAAFVFDTIAEGQVFVDHRTQKIYLVNDETQIEILSRFNLRNFENKYVQVKGLLPGAFTIGDEARPTTSQLVVGQLTTLR